jgi:putative RNA 2'-phosphotransferase
MKDLKHISKFLSLILRHQPQLINIELDENGWANVNELIEKSRTKNVIFDKSILEQVVDTNDKRRFAFNQDKTRIRASQGHTVQVDVELKAQEPPTVLFHGTVAEVIPAIKKSGLQKMQRLHVHLSKDYETAVKVGGRRGKPVILKVNAGQMFNEGHTFYLSANGVWLCNEVPAQYIDFGNETR